MYNKPITQKAKSPLKQVNGPGDIVMKNTEIKEGTEGTPGTPGTSTTTYSYNGELDSNVYNDLQKEIDSGFARKKYGFEGTDVKAYEQSKLGKMKSPNVTATTTQTEGTPGTPGTPDTEESTVTPIYTRDETDAIRPYGAYQNRIVERREGGALERKSKRAVNKLAKRYAQDTDDDGKKGFGKIMSNRKQRRDFRRGADGVNYKDEETKNKVQELRNYRDGVSDVQTDMSSSVESLERSRNQRAQGATRDDKVISKPRKANQTDIERSDVIAQMDRTPGDVDFDGFPMRYDQNVGIKKSSPMKKGYFKGK
jgi:hypothetical protein